MVKMKNGGITIEVWESEVDFYKRAGYEVVADEPAPAVAETPEEAEPEPAPKKAPAKK